jgi:hypothetical protein
VRTLVYPVRRGDDNEELRHSLRAAHANLPHDAVMLVGHLPAWAHNVQHIPTMQVAGDGHKRENVMRAMEALADVGPAEFVLMNDDFFVTRPVASVPLLHRGSLAQHAAHRESSVPGSAYARCLRRTAYVLDEACITEAPLSYELHVPMVVRRTALRVALGLARRYGLPGEQLAPRSLVGNLGALPGERADDVKVYADECLPAHLPFASTQDTSFRYHPVGARLRSMFADPSPYER